MRIASWNLNHWQRRRDADRWQTVESTLRDASVDVALLQETGPPEVESSSYERCSNLRASDDYGNAVVVLNPDISLTPGEFSAADGHVPKGKLGASHPGTIAAAVVRMGDTEVRVASVYGRMYDSGNGTSYASTTMHRIISDLAPWLDRGRGAPEVFLGGDFNCTTQWDRVRDRLMDATVFDRLRAQRLTDLIANRGDVEPLVDCFCPDAGSCRHVRTLRHNDKADSRPFDIDYLFATSGLAQSGSAFVLNSDEIWAVSDHCIVGADLELGTQ